MSADKDPKKNPDSAQLSRLADLFNESGMLRHTPRTGFAFLGSGKESVAEHSFRTCIIGFSLATICGADIARTVFLCLFHDLHEARTGDLNYVYHRYDSCDVVRALKDALKGTGLEENILGYAEEMEENLTLEAKVANDADQLDLICNLQEELTKGNEFAGEWLESALNRLQLPLSREMANTILKTSPNHWWYETVDKRWWINRDDKYKSSTAHD